MIGSLSIEEYLSSLSVYTYVIDLCNKDLEYIPDLTRFTSLLSLWCTGNRLKELPALPNSVISIHCDKNKLVALPERLPRELYRLHCSKNALTSLPNKLPHQLKEIDCSDNMLTYLPFNLPRNLSMLYCNNNQIRSFTYLPERLHMFQCNNNPIMDDLHLYNTYYSITYINKIYSTIQRVKHIYYGEIIRKTIWSKYLEPKIRKKYSPENLLRQMTEAGVNMDENIDIYTDGDKYNTFITNWKI